MISTPPRPRPICKPTLKKEHEVQRQTFQPLTQREIDERIQHVASEVAAVGSLAVDRAADTRASLPRWITPGELVERMQRFLVYN
jgi:hypothetical protein